jgi:hypothetical protein
VQQQLDLVTGAQAGRRAQAAGVDPERDAKLGQALGLLGAIGLLGAGNLVDEDVAPVDPAQPRLDLVGDRPAA